MGVDRLNVAHVGQRQEKRSRVLLAATVESAEGEAKARLRDLSRKGALLECDRAFQLGEQVTFRRGSTAVPARIAWVAGKRVGIEFLRPIEQNEVLVHVGRSAVTAGPMRSRRPPLKGSQLTEKERKMLHAWGLAVGINLDAD